MRQNVGKTGGVVSIYLKLSTQDIRERTLVTPTLLAKLGPVPDLRFPPVDGVLALRPLPKISLASASFFLRKRSWQFQ